MSQSSSEAEQLARAEKLLREIRDGKHSLPGTLVQIDRYFADRQLLLSRDTENPK